jgi:hypothetical protein
MRPVAVGAKRRAAHPLIGNTLFMQEVYAINPGG